MIDFLFYRGKTKELDAKKKALALTMEKIEKTYGKGTIMKLGDYPSLDIEVTNLDKVLR